MWPTSTHGNILVAITSNSDSRIAETDMGRLSLSTAISVWVFQQRQQKMVRIYINGIALQGTEPGFSTDSKRELLA